MKTTIYIYACLVIEYEQPHSPHRRHSDKALHRLWQHICPIEDNIRSSIEDNIRSYK